MKQGILLTAVGHPYYGKMAYNLALTIKASEDIPIAVITDETGLKHLTKQQIAIFYKVIVISPSSQNGFVSANHIRMALPKHTPFEETLALDVDMLWLDKQKPSELFSLLSDRDFTCVNEGYIDLDTMDNKTSGIYTWWADPLAIKEAYSLTGNLCQVRGEFILFRKTPEVKDMYKKAAAIQAKPKIDSKIHGGAITDEFALNIALNMAGITPHQFIWEPAYWMGRHGNRLPDIPMLKKDYFALSLGGNTSLLPLKRIHDIIVGATAYKTGLSGTFPLKSKKDYLTERRNA